MLVPTTTNMSNRINCQVCKLETFIFYAFCANGRSSDDRLMTFIFKYSTTNPATTVMTKVATIEMASCRFASFIFGALRADEGEKIKYRREVSAAHFGTEIGD